eukprot:gene4932-6148_t
MNHAIPKKDKKAKAEFTDKAKKMEDELKLKHKQELDSLEIVTQDLNELILNQTPKQPSKSQLKKAKRLEEEEKRIKQLEEDKKNYVSKGTIEFNDFMVKLRPLNKTIKHINADGDCLYSAISNQLLINGKIGEKDGLTYHRNLRKIASDYIQKNRDEFLPFIISEEGYDECDDPVLEYCNEQVLTTGKWGGHIELKAISHSLSLPIIIFNAYSPDITIGEEFINEKNPKLFLSYHIHAFTLGEHYNSVIPIPSETETK